MIFAVVGDTDIEAAGERVKSPRPGVDGGARTGDDQTNHGSESHLTLDRILGVIISHCPIGAVGCFAAASEFNRMVD